MECPYCNKELDESTLKIVLGDVNFKMIVDNTCCHCSKSLKDELCQILACGHKFCNDCLYDFIKNAEDFPHVDPNFPIYNCYICEKVKNLEEILICKDLHIDIMNLLINFYGKYNNEILTNNFAKTPGKLILILVYTVEGKDYDIVPQLVSMMIKITSTKPLNDLNDIKAEQIDFINGQLKVYGGFSFNSNGVFNIMAMTNVIENVEFIAKDIAKMTKDVNIDYPHDWDHQYDNQDVTLIDVPAGNPVFNQVQIGRAHV